MDYAVAEVANSGMNLLGAGLAAGLGMIGPGIGIGILGAAAMAALKSARRV